jgi:hypothetical protein
VADNVTLNAGSGGSVIKTDDDGAAHWQYVKVAYGADNTQTRVQDSAPLPVEIGDGTTQATVGTDGSLNVHDRNTISTNNSTTTPLAGDATFTGTGDDVSQYSAITIQVDASHDSTTDGMQFQFSTDNTNWDDVYSFTYTAANGARRFQFPTTAQYFRFVFTNTATLQTHFRVQTIHHSQNQLTSVHRLADDVNPDRSAQVMKTAIFARAAGSGDFTAVNATVGGNLKVGIEEGTNTPADGTATPTDAINAGSFSMVYNGTTWDLVREGGVAGSILVDGSGSTQPVSGTVTANAGTGTFTVDGSGVTQPVSGTLTAVTDITNTVAVDNAGTFAVQAAVDELPATAAAADAFANPTTTNILSMSMVYNGTTWDRIREGGVAGSILVDGSGSTQPVSGTLTAVTDITNTVTVDNAGTFAVQSAGANAHDGTTLGNPVLGGARATNSVEGLTQVANADLTHVQADLNGVLLSRPHTTLEEIQTERVTDTAGNSTDFTTFAAPGSGIHNYITTISIYNSSATDVYVDFRNGNAGAVVFTAAAPQTGGSVINLPVPLKFADNTAVAYDVSAAATTVYISLIGFQAKG